MEQGWKSWRAIASVKLTISPIADHAHCSRLPPRRNLEKVSNSLETPYKFSFTVDVILSQT